MAHILTGTWEEVKTHDSELVGRRVTVTVLDDFADEPNYAMLEAIREAEEIELDISSTGDSVAILRQGRTGEMYGFEACE